MCKVFVVEKPCYHVQITVNLIPCRKKKYFFIPMVLDFDTLPRIRTLKRNAGRTTQSAARKQLSRNQPKNQIRMPGQKKQQNKRTTQPYWSLVPLSKN